MPVSPSDDKVWFDTDRRFRQICNQVIAGLAEGNSVLALSHFQSSLSTLEQLLHERAVRYQKFSTFDSAVLCLASSAKVWVGLARVFQPATPLRPQSLARARLLMIVTEHHPRQSKDQAIIESAASLACESELCFHSSLDDPLLRYFNGDAIQRLFKQLGIDEDECISHHLVTTAIRGAQEKIEDLVPKDLQAESMEDWFKYNLPGAEA